MEDTVNINIMQREYDCPICSARFKAPRARMAKLNLIGTDTDLRPYFEGVDVINYEIVVCSNCGFSALHDCYTNFDPEFIDKTRNGIAQVHAQKMYLSEILPEDAIGRYITAIMLLEFKEAKASEYYFLYSRLAWVYRIYEDDDAVENEFLSLKKAFAYLETALQREKPYFYDMDESIITYVLGDMARRIGEYDKANLYIGKAILDPNSTDALRNRAKEVKALIAKNYTESDKLIEDDKRAELAAAEAKNKKEAKKGKKR